MRLVLLLAVCTAACVRPADSAAPEQANAAKQAPARSAAPAGGIVRFKRIVEPREGAFTMLAPADWRASGGIVRVNPLNSGGALNSLGAKLDFTLTSGDGRVTMRWYPETNYVDNRYMPAAAMFPPGSNYNGAMVWPVESAFGYIEKAMFSRQRQGAAGVQVKLRQRLQQAVDGYQKVAQMMQLPIRLNYDAALIVVAYSQGGAQWEEAFYTAIQDMGQVGMGLWSNKDSFSVRAPAGQLEALRPVIDLMLHSVKLNPTWVRGEIQGQIQRGEIARRTQEEIARLDREIVEHRRRTNAEIQNQMHHNIMGTEEYVNPVTKEVEVGSNQWNHRWVNQNGEAIYTDDPNYDPARAGLDGFHRSPVRKRFPDR
ncbi:MAG: hypothetical protein IH602_04805 [Bryobacteraceae bacterium]|nr:hypothetical protein [Bryobacteraceae bacterium]